MTTEPITKRDAAITLLRLGYATLSDIANLADVDRQLVAYWAKAAGIDATERREQFLKLNWESALEGTLRARVPRRSK